MASHVLRDSTGRRIGEIETQHDGRQVIRDATDRRLGEYDPRSDVTRDISGRRFGQGNLLTALLPASEDSSKTGAGSQPNAAQGSDGSGGALLLLAASMLFLLLPGMLGVAAYRQSTSAHWDTGQMWSFAVVASLGVWLLLLVITRGFLRSVAFYFALSLLTLIGLFVAHYGIKSAFPSTFIAYYFPSDDNRVKVAVTSDPKLLANISIANPAPTVQTTPRPQARPTQPSAIPAAAQQEAVRRYPELGVAGSKLNTEFVARYKRYRQERPEYFNDASWPLRLADECFKPSTPNKSTP